MVNLENPDFECLWLSLRPDRLPISVASIYFAVVYNPPNSPVQNYLVSYFNDYVGSLRALYPDCGIVVLGDFNNLDISYFCSQQRLVQVVDKPTRSDSILDLIISNLSQFYFLLNVKFL